MIGILTYDYYFYLIKTAIKKEKQDPWADKQA
jgi:hypothetical protein